MESIKTALIAVTVSLCILIFFVTGSLDLALVVSASLYLLFFYKNYIPIFVASIVLFLANFIFDYLDWSIRFISDLTVDAYILMILGVLLYFRSKNDFVTRYLDVTKKDTRLLYKEVFPKVVISLILAILFFPIVGGPLAAVTAYVFFTVFIRKNNGKIAVGLAVFILFLTSLGLMFRNQSISDELGIYAYYFLLAGTLQEVINLAIKKKGPIHEKHEEEQKPEEEVEMKEVKFPKFIFWGIPAFVLSFALVYLILQKFSLPLPSKSEISNITPTIVVSPSVIPTPTVFVYEVSSRSAELKILLQNGTDITGLAASAAAKLKKAGFKNVNIGNAKRQDYQNWELTTEVQDESLPLLFKYILELSDISFKEASASSGFDVLVIAGFSK